MKPVVVSAHNPMTGPRHLGHYVSTMADWPRLARDHELFVIVDDLIAAILYPGARHQLQARTLQTVREFLATGVDFTQHHIVLTSMVPEAHELALFASMALDHTWCQQLYRESFAGLLNSYQRHELGLPKQPSIAEVVYPQVHLAALTIGLRADFFQGGEEMKGYVPLLSALASNLPGDKFRQPAFLPGRSTFLIGTDGKHMASENAIYLSADVASLSGQLAKVEGAETLRRMSMAIEDESLTLELAAEAKSKAVASAAAREKLVAAMAELLKPFREATTTTAEIGEHLERSAAVARGRVQRSLIALKEELQVTGHSFRRDA